MTDTLQISLQSMGVTDAAAGVLRNAVSAIRSLRPGEPLVAEGDSPTGLHIVLSGVLKSCRLLEGGSAQTLALYSARDWLGVQAMALRREPATIASVSASRLATVSATELKRLMEDHPAIMEALWRATAREAAILQEWILGMGRRTATSHIAHLLCEMAVRLRIAGRARGNVYDFPLTQGELADAAGISPVHVNRVLQALRAEGLIQLNRNQLRIEDWDRLARAGDFDPGYLGLEDIRGAA